MQSLGGTKEDVQKELQSQTDEHVSKMKYVMNVLRCSTLFVWFGRHAAVQFVHACLTCNLAPRWLLQGGVRPVPREGGGYVGEGGARCAVHAARNFEEG